MGIFRSTGKISIDLDAQVLAQLEKTGSNLSLPHDIKFFLCFPTQRLAQEVAEELGPEGFDVKVKPAAADSDWLCLATKTMIPEHSQLVSIRKWLNAMSKLKKGRYDGWGALTVK